MADPYSQSETFASGDPVTAGKHNDAWDDLEAYLNASLGDMAAGQIIVGDASGSPTPVTMSGDATIDEDGEVTVDIPGAVSALVSVSNSAVQSVNSGSPTALTFNTEEYDTDTMHSTVTNTSRLTATTAGVYDIAGSTEFAYNTTGWRQIQIRKNGSVNLARDQRAAFTDSSNVPDMGMAISTQAKLAAGDYVELVVLHNAGSALDVGDVTSPSRFGMTRLGNV